MEKVKDVLMRRDGISEDEADDLIRDFKEELDMVLSGKSDADPDDLIREYFGLEPDYLMEFLW